MTPAQKATAIQWIHGMGSASRRVLANSPVKHDGFRCGVMKAVFLLQDLIAGTDEASMGNVPPETIQEHLEILKAELRECPTDRALQCGRDRDEARSIEDCRSSNFQPGSRGPQNPQKDAE